MFGSLRRQSPLSKLHLIQGSDSAIGTLSMPFLFSCSLGCKPGAEMANKGLVPLQ